MSNASSAPSPSKSSSGGSPGSAFDPHSSRKELHRYATRLFRRMGELTAVLSIQTLPRGSDPPSVEHQDRLDDLRDYIQERQIVDLESQVTQLLQEREHAGEEILDLQEQRDTGDRTLAVIVSPDQPSPDLQDKLDHLTAERVELQDRFDQVYGTLNVQVQAKGREADALQDQIRKCTEEIKREKSRCDLLLAIHAGAVKREKRYRDESEGLKHDVTVVRTAYANAERSITEQKAKILAQNHQLVNLNQERTYLQRELRTALEMLSTVVAGMGSSLPTTKLCLDTDSASERSENSPDDPEKSDQEKSDQRKPDRDPDYTPPPNGSDGSSSSDKHNYDMGGGSDVEETPDQGHDLRDQLLEKDDGAVSPLPTPESHYLTYEKSGSGKSGAPADSDPASKSTSKSKSRSTSDSKSPKNADPERAKDQMTLRQRIQPKVTTTNSGDGIMLLPVAPVQAELAILDRAVNPMVMPRAMAGLERWRRRRRIRWGTSPNHDAAMTLVLSRALPFHPERIFPDHVPRTATPRSDQYSSHLITGQNVRDLMAALLYPGTSSLVANIPRQFSPALVRSDPYLVLFVVERKNRRSHAGARWKQLLQLFLIAISEGWCDLDLLLDPYFIHFPKRTDEVA
ncbi:hypothetical protein PHMEG_00028488 [Phytophthora megakarya]|uniref:Uncharacterized protein n=1 Tax=Phytophthora megakarya TaxID=4795 RepID=A0A225V7D1_9STRA|nr:hypothetical protein PHMEG_00028488 [Phytophthora megakarya]